MYKADAHRSKQERLPTLLGEPSMAFILKSLKSTAALALLFGLNGCGTTVVQSANSPEAMGVVVSGFGKATGAPDLARASIGVEVRARTSEEATASTSTRMKELTEAFMKQGVLAADLKTQNFSANFEQDFRPEPTPLPEPIAPAPKAGKGMASAPAPVKEASGKDEPRGWYRASNTLEVTVRDLKQLGQILGTATTLGANTIYGVNFELSNPQAFEAKAREKAVADAHARATQLARLSGVRLGPILAINESAGFPSPMPMAMPMMAKEGGYGYAAAAPVESGQLEVVSTVSIRYAIEKQ